MTEKQPPIGIDLGTTFSVIAYLDKEGRPQTIPNSEGDLTTPSVVHLENGVPTVGKEASKAATMEPDRVAQFVKREFGDSLFSKPIDGQHYPPEVIQSCVLEKLKRDAEEVVGSVHDVVITVPAFFTEPRRKATQDAGRLAGLNVVDIINEPTAAAIAFGVQKGFLDQGGASKEIERILIYDLGGGTFDATIMTISGNNYTVLATDGDVKLGGIDWDQRIADVIAEEFMAKYRIDPRQDPQGWQRLMRDAEDAKRAYRRNTANVTFEHRGQGCKVALTRAAFADLTGGLLDRTRYTVISLLEEAGLVWSDITRLLLVGGSTRMPMVAEMLEAESGMKVDRSLSADESVAHGAAIYAGLLAASPGNRLHGLKVTNVNSHSLGVLAIERETQRAHNAILIPKNQPLPVTAERSFRLKSRDQRNVAINVIEGGDASGDNSTPIGLCKILDLPGGLPEDARVRVTFTYETNGRLTVDASIPGTQIEAHLEIQRATGMSDSAMDEWVDRLSNSRAACPIVVDSERAFQDKRAGGTRTFNQSANLLRERSPNVPVVDPGENMKQLRRSARSSLDAHKLEAAITCAQQIYGFPEASAEDKCEACIIMGLAYMEHGQEDEQAVDVLKEAVQIDPTSPEALSALARCYWRIAQFEDANAIAQKRLTMSPDDEECLQIIANFQQLPSQ